MTRIRILDVAGFRGIRLAAPLDFTTGCRSMVVYGANGHGKSSYVDALECYFTGKIGHLEKENVSRAAYRHRAHGSEEVAWVRVEFADAASNGKITIDESRRPIFEASGSSAESFRDQARHELIILRHRDLSRFVDLTKQEKLSDLASLIGVEILDRTRAELRTAVRQLETDLSSHNQLIHDRQHAVARLVDATEFDLGHAWGAVTDRARSLGWTEEIGDLTALRAALADIHVLVDPRRDERVKVLEEARRAVEQLAQLPDPIEEARVFIAAFNHLAADEKALQDLALAGLWEAGLTILHSTWWEDERCPLCRQTVASRAAFEQGLDTSLATAVEVRRRRAEVESLRDQARTTIRSTHDALERVARVAQGLEECDPLVVVVSSARDVLKEMLTTVEVPIEPARSLSSEFLQTWESLWSQLLKKGQQTIEALTVAMSEIAVSDEERRRQENYRVLSALESELARLDSLKGEQRVIDTQARSLRRVLREFEQHERHSITGILNQISDNVTRYWSAPGFGSTRYESAVSG